MMKSGTIAKSVRKVFVGGSVVAIEVPAAVEGTAQQMNTEQLRRRIATYARSLRHPVNELLAEHADRGLSPREAYTLLHLLRGRMDPLAGAGFSRGAAAPVNRNPHSLHLRYRD